MNLMVDIETLSTKDNAAIISIGLAAFDSSGVTDSWGGAVNMDEVYGHIDTNTISWWMKQEQTARDYSFRGGHTQVQLSYLFKAFFDKHKPEEVWANSPQFDLTILNNWWHGMKANTKPSYDPGRWPIHYRAHRDCRTLFALAREYGIDTGPAWSVGETAHNPVDDACNQARAVVSIQNVLQSRFMS